MVGVPLLLVDFNPLDPSRFSVNVAPSSRVLGSAVSALISPAMKTRVFYNEWKEILSTEKLVGAEPSSKDLEFWNLANLSTMSRTEGERMNLVLLGCNKRTGLEYLETLLLNGLLRPGNRIILPCLDLNPGDLGRFSSLGAEMLLVKLRTEEEYDLTSMLLVDGLDALSRSLASLNMSGQLSGPPSVSCSNSTVWRDGSMVLEKITGTSYLGESGRVSISEEGVRSSFELKITELVYGRTTATGSWTPENGYLRSEVTSLSGIFSPEKPTMEKKSLVVATILSSPYTMKAEGEEEGGKYEGFVVDLINEIGNLVVKIFVVKI